MKEDRKEVTGRNRHRVTVVGARRQRMIGGKNGMIP